MNWEITDKDEFFCVQPSAARAFIEDGGVLADDKIWDYWREGWSIVDEEQFSKAMKDLAKERSIPRDWLDFNLRTIEGGSIYQILWDKGLVKLIFKNAWPAVLKVAEVESDYVYIGALKYMLPIAEAIAEIDDSSEYTEMVRAEVAVVEARIEAEG